MIDIEKPLEGAIDEATPELPTPPPPDKIPPADIDFDASLAEYDATVKPTEAAPVELPAEPKSLAEYIAEITSANELAETQQHLVAQAHHYRNEIAQARELHDTEVALGQIRKMAPELDCFSDKSLIERLAGRYKSDASFARDWNNRRAVPGAWSTRLQKVVSEYSAEMKQRFDPDATADREAVNFAMTQGARRGGPYDGPAPDFSNMSDAALNAWKEQHGVKGQLG